MGMGQGMMRVRVWTRVRIRVEVKIRVMREWVVGVRNGRGVGGVIWEWKGKWEEGVGSRNEKGRGCERKE